MVKYFNINETNTVQQAVHHCSHELISWWNNWK